MTSMSTPIVFAIDPGTEKSAWLLWIDDRPYRFGIESNEVLLERLTKSADMGDVTVAIEEVASYGMAVGKEVFDTVHWAGRFYQAAQPAKVIRVTRREVKMHLCHNNSASDANIRRVLLDAFGGDAAGRKGGTLYGVKRDIWSALAIAYVVTAEAGGRTWSASNVVSPSPTRSSLGNNEHHTPDEQHAALPVGGPTTKRTHIGRVSGPTSTTAPIANES